MQNLKQYIELIIQFKPKQEEIAILMTGKGTKMYQFFEGLYNKQIKTDKEAAMYLYNKTQSYPPYKTLKTELKKRLANAILILDYKHPILNDVQKAYYNCQKNWAAINILSGRYQTDAAIDLAQTTLNIALKYEITETIVNTSRLLIYLFRIYHPLSKRILYYEKIHNLYTEMLTAEQLSFNFYEDISKNYIRIRATQMHLHQKATQYYNELKKYLSKQPSYRLYFNASLIQLVCYTSMNDYKGALKVIDETIDYFNKKPFELKVQTVSLLHQKIACCIQLKLYKQGKTAADRSATLVQKGTYNWYRDRLLYTQLCFHTQQYQDGWRIILELIQHRSFENQNSVLKDETYLHLSYIKYLIHFKKVKITRKEKEILEELDLSGHINIAPAFHKDKRGMNIPALILQILWLLAEGHYEMVRFRALALIKYRTRHINKEEGTYRTNLFIKMINALEKCEYKRKKVERRTKKTLNELKNTSLNINNNALQTEVLPYEVSWELILNSLII